MSTGRTTEANTTDSEFVLEVTSLSQALHPRTTKFPRPFRWSSGWNLLFATIALCLVLAVFLIDLPRAPTTAAAHMAPLVNPAVQRKEVGTVPTNCPDGTPVDTFSADYAPGANINGTTIWLVGFSPSVDATSLGTAIVHLGYTPQTHFGRESQFLLVAPAAFDQPITIQAVPVAMSSGIVWIRHGETPQTAMTLTFDPHTAISSSSGG